jgi:signal transduction histidine kinase
MRKHLGDLDSALALEEAIFDRAYAYARPFTPLFRRERLLAVAGEARIHLLERHADADVALDGDPELAADVDRNALLQVLQNLLQNAFEAYGPDAAESRSIRVAVRAIQRGSQVEIAVSDRGRGMKDENRSKLYVPFGSTKPGGSGLGLLVARKMVDAHEGEIAIESAPDAGTTVTITLPATQAGTRGAR